MPTTRWTDDLVEAAGQRWMLLTVRSEDLNYLDLKDLFPSSGNATVNLNNSVDIRSIDVDQLMKKMGALGSEMADEDQTEYARRQALVWTKHGSNYYKKGSEHMTKQKTTDLMLQLIYMTRNDMKKLEDDPNFSKEDTGYRIGYLYEKLKTLVDLMKDILGWMHKNKFIHTMVNNHVKIHQRAVKIHVDFLYLFRVMVKLDAKDMETMHEKPTLPSHLKDTDIPCVLMFELGPGIPVPHSDVLHEVLMSVNVMNLTDTPQGSLFDFLFKGSSNNDKGNLDINVLDIDNVRKVVERARQKYHEQQVSLNARRNEKEAVNNKNSHLIQMAMRQMQQSVYATRYRLEATAHFRKHYQEDYRYKIALLVGSMMQIVMKMENLFAQMKNFPNKTHFIWHLIIYEKLLAGNVDVSFIVKKIFELNQKYYDTMNVMTA